MNKDIQHITINQSAEQKFSFLTDLNLLVKGRLTSMVVFTSVIAYLLSSGFSVSIGSVIFLAIGGFFIAGAANIFNEVLEKDYDKLMKRTLNRPIAAGRMSMSTGVMIAGFMALIGMTILGMFNPLTAFFGTLSLVIYAFIYTPLKRVTPMAVTIGALPGAMPLLIGSVAYDGYVSELAIWLFALQFLWQFTHFWAIGVLSYAEYHKAGYTFIPGNGNSPAKRIRYQALISAVCLLPLTALLDYTMNLHLLSASLMYMAAAGFIYYAIEFVRDKKDNNALSLMFSSLIYLPVVLSILLIDQLF